MAKTVGSKSSEQPRILAVIVESFGEDLHFFWEGN